MTGKALTNELRAQHSGPPLGWPLLQVPDEVTGIWSWPNLEQSLKNQIIVVLKTMPGEQLMAADFGAGLESELHAQDSIVTRARIRERIAQSLKAWENRILVDAISVEASATDGRDVFITIAYRAHYNALPQNIGLTLPLGSA